MFSSDQKQHTIQNFILFCFDLIAICISYALALVTRAIIPEFFKHTQYYCLILFFAIILCLLSYVLLDLNQKYLSRSRLAEFFFVLKYDIVLGAGLGMFLFLTQNAQDFSRLAFLYFVLYNLIITYLFHILVKLFLVRIYMRSKGSSKMMLVTTSLHADKITSQLNDSPEWLHEVSHTALLDTISEEELFNSLSDYVVDEVLIYLPEYNNQRIGKLIRKFEMAGIVVHVNIDPFDHMISHKTTSQFSGLSVMTYSLADFDFHRMMVKRIMDIMGAIIGLLVTVILTPFIAIAIKMDSKGPVFYKQKRIGLNGREFTIFKFRSMYTDSDIKKKDLLEQNEINGPMFKITNDPRITRVGKFLRRTSLDELPQFYNILIGQMSLVGTRPPTPDEYEHYNLQYMRRLSIKPGLTGLWQISGRSDITDFEDVVNLDLHYIDHWSLGLDIKILLQTPFIVLKGKGAK